MAIRRVLEGVKVLLVDDEPDSLEVICLLLSMHGAEAECVPTMEEGLARLARDGHDLVLTDLAMPDHDGFELLERVRAMRHKEDVPVVAFTAYAQSYGGRILAAGFDGLLSKPVESDVLIKTVIRFGRHDPAPA